MIRNKIEFIFILLNYCKMSELTLKEIVQIEQKKKLMERKKKNKGTGAGGAKTNENGKKLEEKTREVYTLICDIVKVLEKTTAKHKVEEVNINGRILNRAPEGAFRRWDKLNGFSKDDKDYKTRGLHGAKNPDDAFIDMVNNLSLIHI